MTARLAQLVVACLLSGALELQAADGEAAVKLTGIAHFNNRSRALLEIQPQPGRPVIKPILAEGESIEGVEVKEIDSQSGRVRVVHNGIETFYMVGTSEPTAARPTLHFKSADLAQVLEIYQMLSDRTVLRSASLPGTKISILTQTELTHAEAVQALDSILAMNGVATRPHGEKFVFVVQTGQTNRLSFISDPPGASSGGEVLPAGLIKFMEADVSQVLEICQELRQRTLLKPSNLPHAKISVRSQTEMTRDQAIWMLDATLALADVAMIPHGEKFVFVLPGLDNPPLPAIDTNPAVAQLRRNEPLSPTEIIKQTASLRDALNLYASLVEREPLPLEPTTPAARLSLRPQTTFTPVEAIFALDALAAMNHLKFVFVGDKQVKILPAALARRETNPAQ